MILLPLSPPQPDHGEGGGTRDDKGVPTDFYAIGSLAGEVVWITMDGQGWTGQFPARRPYVRMNRQLLPAHEIPDMPDDGDARGWDAWAATIRERIAAVSLYGHQQTIEGIA